MILRFLLPIFIAAPMFAASDNLTPSQRDEVKTLITETIKQQPKIVIDAIMEFKKEQMAQYQKDTESKIAANTNEIFNQNNNLVLGNPKGTTTIVEFIDYNCGHCKVLAQTLKTLTEQNKDVKIIVKELPIFGGDSEVAARAAVAAAKQNKFNEFHYTLINNKEKTTEASITKAAETSGLNMKQFTTDLNAEKTKEHVQNNIELAGKLDIMATPALIFNKADKNIFVGGSLPLETINNIISQLK